MATVTIKHQHADQFRGTCDLVFTHPYGPLAKQIAGKPMIINVFRPTRAKINVVSAWIGPRQLHEVSRWGKGLHNTVYVTRDLNEGLLRGALEGFVEDHTDAPPNAGWFPLEMCMLLLRTYAKEGMTIYDGFMGRGTVAKAALELGMNFVGGDASRERCALTARYLELEGKLQWDA